MKAKCNAIKTWVESHEVTHSFSMATNGLQTISTWSVKEPTSRTGLFLCMSTLAAGIYTFIMIVCHPNDCHRSWQQLPEQLSPNIISISSFICIVLDEVKEKSELREVKLKKKISLNIRNTFVIARNIVTNIYNSDKQSLNYDK